MYKCTHCRKQFDNEPMVGCNGRNYCSYKCLPDSVMDRPYSFEYFNMIEEINDIREEAKKIVYRSDKLELKDRIKELIYDCSLTAYGDNEGLFYKRQIIKTLSTLDILYKLIHNVPTFKRGSKSREVSKEVIENMERTNGE